MVLHGDGAMAKVLDGDVLVVVCIAGDMMVVLVLVVGDGVVCGAGGGGRFFAGGDCYRAGACSSCAGPRGATVVSVVLWL